jgi:hypothetical protein
MGIKANKLVRHIRDANHEATKNMTPEKRRQYYQEKAEAALKEAREISKSRADRS